MHRLKNLRNNKNLSVSKCLGVTAIIASKNISIRLLYSPKLI